MNVRRPPNYFSFSRGMSVDPVFSNGAGTMDIGSLLNILEGGMNVGRPMKNLLPRGVKVGRFMIASGTVLGTVSLEMTRLTTFEALLRTFRLPVFWWW